MNKKSIMGALETLDSFPKYPEVGTEGLWALFKEVFEEVSGKEQPAAIKLKTSLYQNSLEEIGAYIRTVNDTNESTFANTKTFLFDTSEYKALLNTIRLHTNFTNVTGVYIVKQLQAELNKPTPSNSTIKILSDRFVSEFEKLINTPDVRSVCNITKTFKDGSIESISGKYTPRQERQFSEAGWLSSDVNNVFNDINKHVNDPWSSYTLECLVDDSYTSAIACKSPMSDDIERITNHLKQFGCDLYKESLKFLCVMTDTYIDAGIEFKKE